MEDLSGSRWSVVHLSVGRWSVVGGLWVGERPVGGSVVGGR